jgi:hypothetical protein
MTLRKGLFCLAALAFAAPSTLRAQAAPPPVTYGAFSFYREADEMTDEDRSFIFTEGDASGSRDLALLWQCMEDGVHLALRTGYMGGNRDDQVIVRYRFDTDPASEDALWNQSSDSRGAFAPDDLVAELTARARTAQRVVIRITDPLDGEVKTRTFPLNGFTRAIDRLPCAAGAAAGPQTPQDPAPPAGVLKPRAP